VVHGGPGASHDDFLPHLLFRKAVDDLVHDRGD
jgi:hypothetical protein